MKAKSIINRLVVAGLCSMSLVACEDLDTEYHGGYVTTDQKQAILKLNPDMAEAGVMGISSVASSCMTVFSNHFDFGYPGVMIGLDLQTEDYLCPWTGYNWYRYWQGFTSPKNNGTPAAMAWYHLYSQIANCNAVAAGIPADSENGQLKFYRAQAVGTRGFDYLQLAQLFQFNYTINPQAPGVPLITDENSEAAAKDGAPRASLEEMYTQILKDLTEAIDLLSSTNVTAEQIVDTKAKRMITLPTAYGLRARAYMAMHRYADAAADAQAAIDHFSGRPLSLDAAGRPGFTNLDETNWMWGIAIAETDRVVTSGIVNFPSMTCTFCSNGYVAVGAWKYASNVLYEGIPATDVRKGWFLDENMTSANLNTAEQAYIDANVATNDQACPYIQVKFAGYNNVVGQATNASDIPLMRIEEMYYILAEAKVQTGDVAGGKQVLIDFIQTYRNPSYKFSSDNQQAVLDEIFRDKKVELFGEGLTWFDYMRLDKGVNRTLSNNCPPAARFNIPSYSQDPGAADSKTLAGVLIYCIPIGEINGNPAISNEDNNLQCNAPKPVQ